MRCYKLAIAGYFIVTMIAITMIAAELAHASKNRVIFKAEFHTPLLTGALRRGTSSLLHADVKIVNDTGAALRFSTFHSVLPGLLDSHGAMVHFDYGVNRSRLPRASDYPLLQPGHSLIVSVTGTMAFLDQELDWRGADGIIGYWRIDRARAPYRLRLHYVQKQNFAGPFAPHTETLHAIWTGDTFTAAVELPINFE